MSKYEADEKHFEQDHVEFAENGGKRGSQPQIEGNIQLIGNDGEVRLVPTPSGSKHDPLSFGKARKVGLLVTVIWFSIIALSVVGGVVGGFGALAPIFFGLYIPQGVTPDHVVRLLTWPSLFTGLGNFVFLPLALVVGRRPVFIFASFMLVGSSVWAAKSGTSYESHLGARLLQGFSAGATESLLPLIITDMTFVHQRSKYFGAYWVAQSLFTACLNTASSYIAEYLQWAWYYWIFTILAVIGVLLVIFAAPETKFERPAFAIDGKAAKVDAFGNLVMLTEEEAANVALDTNADQTMGPKESMEYVESLLYRVPATWSDFKVILTVYKYMVLALLDPAIIWSLGASSIVLGTTIGQSLTFGTILQEKYHWAHQNTGLIYLGTLPICVLSFLTSGWGGDKINLWFAKRNGGVHLPEHRLPAIIVPTILGLSLGVLMYGFCADAAPNVHWIAIVISQNMSTYLFICILITTTTYCVESMTHHAGAALVMVVGGKNILSFGLATAITDLANTGRNAYANGILAGCAGGWLLLAWPLYFYMPRYRKWKAERATK